MGKKDLLRPIRKSLQICEDSQSVSVTPELIKGLDQDL